MDGYRGGRGRESLLYWSVKILSSQGKVREFYLDRLVATLLKLPYDKERFLLTIQETFPIKEKRFQKVKPIASVQGYTIGNVWQENTGGKGFLDTNFYLVRKLYTKSGGSWAATHFGVTFHFDFLQCTING